MNELSRKIAKGAFEAVDAFWRGQGAVGRLHNIIIYIRCTPQRLEEFASAVVGGKLKDFDELQVSKLVERSRRESCQNSAFRRQA
jgi:hypothetical protein